jgi:integrase
MKYTNPAPGTPNPHRSRRTKSPRARPAKKRANHEGTIFPRKDKTGEIVGYRGSITVGWKDGRQDRRYFSAKTRDEVRALIQQASLDAKRGMLANAGSLTFGAYLDAWLEHKTRETRATTVASYRGIVNAHLRPILGNHRLDKLQPVHVDHLHKTMLEKGVSRRTVQYAHVLMHGALQHAVQRELLPRNVASAVRAPAMQRREMRVWTPEEATRFLENIKRHRLYAMFYLALTTGMRRGELLGLRWADVNLENARLRVRSSLVELNNKLVFSEPKTQASKRTITLAHDAVRVLEEHHESQRLERERQGSRWQDHDLVFPSESGTPMNSGNLVRMFKRLARAAGVPEIRIHDLRHTHASLLALNGVSPKVIADRLGHTNVGFTLQVYTHVFEEQRAVAALPLEELLRKAG